MRRYSIEIDGRRFEVDVQDTGDQRYRVQVDGRDFDVTLTGQEEVALAQVAPQIEPHGTPVAIPAQAAAHARPAPAPGMGAAPAHGSSARPAAGASADVLGAPMPGVILRVSVAAGARVRRGQDIAVLEAMKMENIIRAPREGLVAEVCVEAGQKVGHGQAIVRLAPGAS
jgi:glutaconyl-CoA/methylmalonyl-CoA decarboxylase subunit gamma